MNLKAFTEDSQAGRNMSLRVTLGRSMHRIAGTEIKHITDVSDREASNPAWTPAEL